MAVGGRSNSGATPTIPSREELSDQLVPLLPLRLIKSETIPPAPNRSESTFDWLSDYSGLSWIAYGAASLLVISHFPSPLSLEQSQIGPIYRQVIELSNHDSSIVKAVAWSPSIPSQGEVAVAIENFICLCSDTSPNTQGSFYWIQAAVLAQCCIVEAIKWTGSGDGIISAGSEVVLWKRKSKSWEIAWKYIPERAQTMVSATWSTGGPVATAGTVSTENEPVSVDRCASRCVLICQMDEQAGFVKSELRHPQTVVMIQWRPSIGPHNRRDVLLTCCFDGTVRLWSEIDSGRAKKTKQSFHVVAVIEINHSLNGTLGMDAFVTWAAEMQNFIEGPGFTWYSASEGSKFEMPGRCEWLISFGPRMLLTFWAIHCLDDISPLRFPRVTLWKTLDLAGAEGGYLQSIGNLNSKHYSLFIKAIISRSQLHGPPIICSLFRLLSDNSMGWSQLFTLESSKSQSESLSLDGHSGSILQVAVHPYCCEVKLAVSLDSDGLVMFWYFSTFSSCILEMSAQVLPTWKLVGRISTKSMLGVQYTCLRWAPSVLNDYSVLILGHSVGFDCLMIRIAENEKEKLVYHKLCTIPFTFHNHVDGPTNIFAMPLPSTCRKTFISNHFLLLGIWMKEFQALSWQVTLHSDDLSGSPCDCNFEVRRGVAELDTWRYESFFADRRYRLVVEPWSSKLPDSHNCGPVTSFAVVSPGSLMPSMQQTWSSSNRLCNNSAPYQMATGYSDGSIRLWRSTCSKSSTPHSELACIPWELVGMFNSHQVPVTVISLSVCGGKIATISMENYQDNIGALCIWQSVRIMDAGKFMLEDKISLDELVIALNWFSLGNGQLLLGVCMQNELRIYSQKSCGSRILPDSEKLLETHIWYCIATCFTPLAARDFLWGPGATPVLVHDKYFCLFSKWSFHMDKTDQTMFYVQCSKDNSCNCMGRTDNDVFCAVLTDCDVLNVNELSLDGISEKCKPELPSAINVKSDYPVSYLFSRTAEQQNDSGARKGLRSLLEVALRLRGLLPSYHPETLLLNLCSGNWKHVCVAVRHLVSCLTSDNTSVGCERAYDSIKPKQTIPQIHLSNYFEESSSAGLGDKGLSWDRDAAFVSSAVQFRNNSIDFSGHNVDANSSCNTFSRGSEKSEISGFIEIIEKFDDITAITSLERVQLLAVLDLLAEIRDSSCSSAYESLDEPGRRFWVALRFQQLLILRRFGGLTATNEIIIDSGIMGWAFQSDCQDSLLASFLSNEPSWNEMRFLGVGFWFTDATQLRTRMEKLARLQYLKSKDPKDCALLYIALNRVQVLAGLFKLSRDEKDKPLVGFLSRNFQEEKNKAAALKNAYVLMGRHQLDLAIAFFLLGGDTSSAVSVCAKTLGDEQLALVICRLIEGNGGPLERHLISRILLPAAMERGDCWLACLFEWTLGNYVQSFLRLLGFGMDLFMKKPVLPSNQVAFLDPTVGQYCLLLTSKTFMKNYIGESAAVILARWAVLMTSIALNRRGLPIEALKCLSSSLSTIEDKDEGNIAQLGNRRILHGILEDSSEASNWLSGDVALHMEFNDKLDTALYYVSNLVVEHPSWTDTILSSSKPPFCSEEDRSCQYKLSLENFQHKLNTGLVTFEQKYSLNPVDILNMILVYTCNNGKLFLGYHILHGYTSREVPLDAGHDFDTIFHYPPLPKLFLKATEEATCFFARYLMCYSIIYSPINPSFPVHKAFVTHRLPVWDTYIKRSIHLLENLRATLKMYCPCFIPEDIMVKTCTTVDLLEYYIIFTSAWLQKNLKRLIVTIYPILVTYNNGKTPSKVDVENLTKRMCKNLEFLLCDSVSDDVEEVSVATDKRWRHEQSEDLFALIPDDERWQILGVCLWRHLLNFTRSLLNSFPDSLTNICSSKSPSGTMASSIYVTGSSESDRKCTMDAFMQVPAFFAKLLDNALACIATNHAKQLASVLSLKLEKGFPVPTLLWLEKSDRSHSRCLYNSLKQDIDILQLMSNENEALLLRDLWEISVDPVEICKALTQENMNLLQYVGPKFSKSWSDVHKGTCSEYRKVNNGSVDPGGFSSSSDGDGRSPGERRPLDNSVLPRSRQKASTLVQEATYFQNPEEIYKRNGELLEAMCINSANQQQAAIASNRKGILFFNWKDDDSSRGHSEYIWSEADWPHNRWDGSDSTPTPKFVSPGIGHSSKEARLGLGGATIGLGSSVRRERDLTTVRAFGIGGYGGLDTSGLGWGAQEDFKFVDPPATVDNISTRALSSHPSQPVFLAGSSNTHIYLWEFGKENATATYGVLPATNVAPPYALASIAALRFDRCGHRFVTAALDGTICTWQLEVGGRGNTRPTESLLCFNRHALDATYVGASGSVIAAAGYSSDDVNVVVWDTLAPTTTSQASLICHEGGARSVSVFDNNFGSGSISPLIITGGKGGDVGLHDFRFIATGKTKRHRHSDNNEHNNKYSPTNETHAGDSSKFGEQNSKGMLWYIPRAHSGSITKIATIPDTSFFLTGSQDGDVKLWDAKKAELVVHWPKLHERHTFLQPSSRGFGGIVRAAVTDIQVLSQGFLTCGGDGTVRILRIKDFPRT